MRRRIKINPTDTCESLSYYLLYLPPNEPTTHNLFLLPNNKEGCMYDWQFTTYLNLTPDEYSQIVLAHNGFKHKNGFHYFYTKSDADRFIEYLEPFIIMEILTGNQS